MSLVAIAVVLGIAYLWGTRGFFSALINMVCVIVAGAIAYGMWETVAYLLLDKAPAKGFLAFVSSNAWGIALAGTFAVSLAVLRLVVDSVIRANADTQGLPKFLGGVACGLVAGVITAGILVQSIAMLRVSPKFMGYDRLVVGDGSVGGSIQKSKTLILPVDDITNSLYAHLSQTLFSSNTSLAAYYPNFADAAGGMRMSEGEGKARNTLKPEDFTVKSWYTVGKGASTEPPALLNDTWGEGPQKVFYPENTPFAQGDSIAGFVVQFSAGAREKSGQIVMGAGQARLVVERGSDRRTVYPIAVIAQSEAASQEAARFRFDAPFHIATVGGAANPTMAFEFPVPAGFEPKALYIKNVRVRPSAAPSAFASAGERDGAIRSGSLVGGGADAGPLDTSAAESISVTNQSGGRDAAYEVSNAIGKTIQKGQETPMEVDDKNRIVNGQKKFDLKSVSGGNAIDRALQIRTLATTADTVIFQVNVSADSRSSILGRAVASAESLGTPVLIDSNGVRYQAVGYIYEDREYFEVKYTPGDPVRALTQLPPLSRSRPDQKLKLIFRPSLGVTITSFAVGNRVVTEYTPGVVLNQTQR